MVEPTNFWFLKNSSFAVYGNSREALQSRVMLINTQSHRVVPLLFRVRMDAQGLTQPPGP